MQTTTADAKSWTAERTEQVEPHISQLCQRKDQNNHPLTLSEGRFAPQSACSMPAAVCATAGVVIHADHQNV
eukprot:6213201-Pleurochrysis_carterae.AAC.2